MLEKMRQESYLVICLVDSHQVIEIAFKDVSIHKAFQMKMFSLKCFWNNYDSNSSQSSYVTYRVCLFVYNL